MQPNQIFAEHPPGVRMVAGRPYTFDLDARNDWSAIEAKLDYERADLTDLPDEQLLSLFYRSIRLAALSGNTDCRLFERVCRERDRRDELARAA